MLIEIEEENVVPEIMIDDMRFALNSIEEFKDHEYLQGYQQEDLEYDLNLLRALKTVYRHYTIRDDWEKLVNYEVSIDHDLTETVI